MSNTTIKQRINSFISAKGLKIPHITQDFVNVSISRLSNGQKRRSSLWMEGNRTDEEKTTLRTLSWVGKIMGWHVDHIQPVSRGGSYNVSNLRLLPPSLNRIISNLGWDHKKLNEFLDHLGPIWKEEFGIPADFVSLPAEEFLRNVETLDSNT